MENSNGNENVLQEDILINFFNIHPSSSVVDKTSYETQL